MEGLACADPGARTPIGASGNPYPMTVYLRHMRVKDATAISKMEKDEKKTQEDWIIPTNLQTFSIPGPGTSTW